MCSTLCFLRKCHGFCVSLEVNMGHMTHHLDVQYNRLQAPSFPESIIRENVPPANIYTTTLSPCTVILRRCGRTRKEEVKRERSGVEFGNGR